MKKIIIFILLVVSVFFGIVAKIDKEQKIKEELMMAGWYVEITTDYINVRKKPGSYDTLLGKVKKGEKYEVLDINLDSNTFFWYYIEFTKGEKGWIASERKHPYLIDHNNPTDVAVPTLKFFDDVYYVDSIDEINYDHLEVKDDKDDFVVSHKVYKETKENLYQYWITYTVVDGAGKTASKTQKIVFLNEPKDNEVLEF